MEKNQFEMIFDAIKDASIKTVSSLRKLLEETDFKAADAPLSGALSARDRIEALFDRGTFMESGAFVRRRASEITADSDEQVYFDITYHFLKYEKTGKKY